MLMLTHAVTSDVNLEFAADIRDGLSKQQKELPSKYLYDEVGSRLFEVISVLPEYGLTRADERLLRRYASDIVEQLPRRVAVAELGSGTDLEKPVPELLAAYDDALGVTAAFNLNLLTRVNRELGADFALHQFEHLAKHNPEARSVEMHIRSKQQQTVTLTDCALSVDFSEGETIWTESSHKYSYSEIFQIAEAAGFSCKAQWIDNDWPFAESLLVAE